ncbi:family 43 glycosylhydrolase [Nonomuraea sp. C10]|uniref:family 43 glycosylhydrolase n=1 Tax=Nonomuraea sp. C10 TaxID=2600577 RepID=UPI001C9D1FE7|nr:family 43 glycosylhydrolase [Nonomuraea sp. C10]
MLASLPGTARRILTLAVVTIVLSALFTTGRAQAAPGPSFTNPVVPTPNSADPTLVFHNGFYYYVATTWNSDVVMRRSATIAGLRSAPEQVVVRTGGNTMWAPHLEMVGSRWYLYYSVEQGSLPPSTATST